MLKTSMQNVDDNLTTVDRCKHNQSWESISSQIGALGGDPYTPTKSGDWLSFAGDKIDELEGANYEDQPLLVQNTIELSDPRR